MNDLFEEIRDLELDEDLPKDLAKAFRRGFEQPRGADERTHRYGYMNIGNRSPIDFKNSTYTEITPEEALKLYKEGNSRNVYAILGGQIANTYLGTGENGEQKRLYDFKAVSDGSDEFKKANGKAGNNSMWLSPKEFYNNASKIYVANEVNVDPDLRNKRAENPESRYNWGNASAGNTAQKPIPAPRQRKDSEAYPRAITSRITFDGNGKARYESGYLTNVRDNNGQPMSSRGYYSVDDWKNVLSYFKSQWGWNDADTQSAQYIVDKLSGKLDANPNSPLAKDWSQHDQTQRAKASLRYKDAENDLQRVMRQGKEVMKRLNSQRSRLNDVQTSKARNTSAERLASRKQEYQNYIDMYQDRINRAMRELLTYQDRLDDADAENDAEIERYDRQIADVQDEISKIEAEMKSLFGKKTESLEEDLNVIQLTPEDQAANIRSLIRTCWDSVDQYSMYARQLNEFGSQQALATVNSLINDLYIAIGSFEDALGDVDQKSAAIDAADTVQAVVEVAPQVAQQMAAQPIVAPTAMIEKFQLSEELDEKPESQKELEEPIKKELKEVEEYREEKVDAGLNPEQEKKETSNMPIDLEESVEDDTYDPKFLEALLKLEEE